MYPADFAISRRAALGLLSATGVGAITSRASAQQPAAPAAAVPVQGAGFYRFGVGEFKLALVSDGGFPFGAAYPLFGRNAGKDDVDAACAEAFLNPAKLMGHVNTLLIQTGKQNILVDTGCGSSFGPTTGKLVSNLANAGLKPEDINAIIITHAHPDHINGLADAKGLSLFPNATYFAAKAEQEFWSGAAPDLSKSLVDPGMAKLMTASAATLFAGINGKVQLVGNNDTIVEGIKAILAPGHTPGHLALHIASGSEQLIYVTDAAHHFAVNLPHPDWFVGFDTDPVMAAKSRRMLLTRAAVDRALISGAHLPFPAVGHVRSNRSGGFEWVPSVWEW